MLNVLWRGSGRLWSGIASRGRKSIWAVAPSKVNQGQGVEGAATAADRCLGRLAAPGRCSRTLSCRLRLPTPACIKAESDGRTKTSQVSLSVCGPLVVRAASSTPKVKSQTRLFLRGNRHQNHYSKSPWPYRSLQPFRLLSQRALRTSCTAGSCTASHGPSLVSPEGPVGSSWIVLSRTISHHTFHYSQYRLL